MRGCAASCLVTRLRGSRRFHPGHRLAPSATRRRGIDPRSDRLGFPCSAGASCTPDTSNAPSACSPSRGLARRTRRGDRSDGPGLPWSRWRSLAGRSDGVGHRSRTRAAATRAEGRLACALEGRVSCASWSSSLPVPLLGPRERKRGRTPARSIRLGRGHRAGGITPVEVPHRPRSQNQ
jgi:hypothetical protein